MKTYKIEKENFVKLAEKTRELTANPVVATKLRQAMSPQSDGSLLIYLEQGDEFADAVIEFGEEI